MASPEYSVCYMQRVGIPYRYVPTVPCNAGTQHNPSPDSAPARRVSNQSAAAFPRPLSDRLRPCWTSRLPRSERRGLHHAEPAVRLLSRLERRVDRSTVIVLSQYLRIKWRAASPYSHVEYCNAHTIWNWSDIIPTLHAAVSTLYIISETT